jgi:hypothetical protein
VREGRVIRIPRKITRSRRVRRVYIVDLLV